jgi:hypothetical protein
MPETQYIKPENPRGRGFEKMRVEYEIFDPKVKIRNNVYPFPHEYYNCESCRRARFIMRPEPGVLKVKCLIQNDWIEENQGIIDNGCPAWARKIHAKEV